MGCPYMVNKDDQIKCHVVRQDVAWCVMARALNV